MKRLILLLLAAASALPAFLASAALPETTAMTKAVAFIRGTQQADGGFGGFGPGQTMDAIMAIRAAGFHPADFVKGGKSPADFLAANAAGATNPGAAAKAALAARAMDLDPRNVAGVDFVATIIAAFKDGKYADDAFTQSISMIGLACTGNDIPAGAILRLRDTQLADGGWGFDVTSDPDTTAIAAQALLAAGVPRSDPAVTKAIAYFKAKQGADGGWGFDPAESNVDSTAFVVQALIAAGEDPLSDTYTKAGKTAISFILSKQLSDGSFEGFDPAYAAEQAVPALAGRTFCNAPVTALGTTPPPAAVTATATPSATPTGSASTSSTASPSATKTATKTPTKAPAVRTATPRSPRTGTGLETPESEAPWLAFIVAGGAILLLTAGAFAAANVRRPRR